MSDALIPPSTPSIPSSGAIRVLLPPRPAAGYEVVVRPGVLEDFPALLREAAPAPQYAIIADSTVADLVGQRMQGALIEEIGRAHV